MKSETQLMISIGGGFHATALTENNRKQFADSALQIVRKYSLDGIDIDWEFPAWGTAHHNDKHTFTLLLKEMRETFDSYSRQSMGKEILLSAAVAAQYTIIERAYSAPQLIKYVNFLNLMTYDYNLFQWYWPFVGHNSPLSGPQWRVFTIFNTFNMQWSANYWHRLGVDKSKIAVGVPTYGRRFRLALPWFTAPGSPALSTSQDMTYSQICEFLRADGTTAAFDRQSGAPFAYGNNHWLTYESTQSAAQKAKWIRDEGFGGVMTFSLNADDFRGQCPDSRQFAIHSAIKDALQS
ncbi:unnamed protein product [Medioppia subpectinata]|uniref:GH18 domain-containing protein n=1 Tax=Medioppia subpectinata TaxID=1979941 RepID=A0A7R9KFG0_9ACAR|nr:unnamed protein product [Medioppia subpectinata]CAG2102373.1 unnamed protein product [Medioppia subpectinata]